MALCSVFIPVLTRRQQVYTMASSIFMAQLLLNLI